MLAEESPPTSTKEKGTHWLRRALNPLHHGLLALTVHVNVRPMSWQQLNPCTCNQLATALQAACMQAVAQTYTPRDVPIARVNS
eukprot:1143657-Pelagomonas_calceolata.AAC.4